MSSGHSGKDEDFVEYFRDELPNPTFIPDEMREQAQASEDAYYAQHGGPEEEQQGEGWYSVPLEGAIYQPPEIAKGPPEEPQHHVARLGGGGGGGDYYGDAQPGYGSSSGAPGAAPMSGAGGGRGGGGDSGRGHAPSFSSPSELAQTLGMPPSPAENEGWDPLMPPRHSSGGDPFAGAQEFGAENWGSPMPSSSMPSSSGSQNSSFPFPPLGDAPAQAMDPFSDAGSSYQYADESFGSNGFSAPAYSQEPQFGEEEKNNSILRLPPLAPAAFAPDSIPEDPFMPRAAAPVFQHEVPYTRSADDVPTMRPSFGISIGASIPGLGGNSSGGLLGDAGLTQIAPKKKKRAKKVF